MALVGHSGGCHCGAVRIEVDSEPDATVYACNCSICTALNYLHLLVTREHFRVLAGTDMLTSYKFNSRTADHLFCKQCGVKCFYVPRSHPDGYSVNFRCLDQTAFGNVTVTPFDGANWEASIDELPPAS